MAIEIFGLADDRSLRQLQTCIAAAQEDALPAALCADHHPGYAQPIGGVIGYREHLSVSGVGYDIGCGNKAVKLPIKMEDVKKDQDAIADLIYKSLSFGMGRTNNERVEDPVIDLIANAEFKPQRKLLQVARNQLGTIGGNNHYVDLFVDQTGYVWIGVHFGSRGFGHKTAMGFLAMAEGKRFMDRVPEGGMDDKPVLLKTSTILASEYVEAQALALRYAQAGREWVVKKVMALLGVTSPVTEIHNHHNYASLETHFGENLWVVRKGATSAFPGQLGFVGGSMRDIAVILQGIPSAKGERALYSTVHGAGRRMGRKEAGGSYDYDKSWKCKTNLCAGILPSGINPLKGETSPACPKCGGGMIRQKVRILKRPGKVNFTEAKKEVEALGISLRGGNAEQTHHSYKNLADVLQCHEGTIQIVQILKPFIVCMADGSVPDYRE